MKMLTHLVFTAGLLTFLLSLVLGAPESFAIGVVLSVLVNYFIDELGHYGRNGMSVRSPLTHSVFTAPIWGVGTTYVLWLAGSTLGLIGPGLEWVVVVSGLVAAYSHLLLDSMTERGVYLLAQRAALAHFRSDNGLLNVAFMTLGLVMFLV